MGNFFYFNYNVSENKVLKIKAESENNRALF